MLSRFTFRTEFGDIVTLSGSGSGEYSLAAGSESRERPRESSRMSNSRDALEGEWEGWASVLSLRVRSRSLS